jgi:hypothetical protein
MNIDGIVELETRIQMGLLKSSAWTCGAEKSQVERHRSSHLGLGSRQRQRQNGQTHIQIGLLGSSAWTYGAEKRQQCRAFSAFIQGASRAFNRVAAGTLFTVTIVSAGERDVI